MRQPTAVRAAWRRMALGAALLLAAVPPAAGVAAPAVDVVYPGTRHVTSAPSVFVLGSAPQRSRVTVNGRRATVYPNGAFVAVVPLRPGTNRIVTVASGPRGRAVDRRAVRRLAPPASLPVAPTLIRRGTIEPAADVSGAPGETVRVSFQGSPGGRAAFSVGGGAPVAMREVDRRTAGIRGLYAGEYAIGGGLERAPVAVTLVGRSGRAAMATAPGTLTSWPSGPEAAETLDRAVLRESPEGPRLGTLPPGIRLRVVALIGDRAKVRLSPATAAWTAADALAVSEGADATGDARGIATRQAGDATEVRIALTARLPFVVREQTDGLALTVYGVRTSPAEVAADPTDRLIESIRAAQYGSVALRLAIRLGPGQQWGYRASYEDTTLVLAIRHAPAVDPGAPLAGRTIAVDPGHGGSETGAVGPTRLAEKDANLAIVLRLRDLLARAGARVVMTRTDDRQVSLDERVEAARQAGAEVLLSIHNNALPDGQDPRARHGSSTYYYHPASRALAAAVHRAVLEGLRLRDEGLRRRSFALTRPTEMPAILVEIAYVIYPPEEARLRSAAFQQRAALALLRGLEAFFREAE